MDSILTSIKKMLGIDSSCTQFDPDIIMHTNSVFSILTQMGVGPETGFLISDATDSWSDYIKDLSKLEMVKTYIFLKVKLIFDPPMSATVTEAMNRQISEFEWRLNIQVDKG